MQPRIISLLLLLVALLHPVCAEAGAASTAQESWPGVYEGIVTEPDGTPVESAIVRIFNANGSVASYALTDENGHFTIKRPDNMPAGELTAKIDLIGYEGTEVKLGKTSRLPKAQIIPSAVVLPEMVVSQPVVHQKGDTIVYNVEKLKSKTDVTIEDVLKKIPGITVGASGEIKYQDKSLTSFYIEGSDMLKGRYSLATRNIRADDVLSINVYENHQPVKALKEIVSSSQAAVDLKLKSSSMLRPMGAIKAGGGANDDAIGLADIFSLLISRKHQALVTAKAGNAGVSFRDQVKDFLEGSPSNPYAYNAISGRAIGGPGINRSRFERSREAVASLNYLTKLPDNRQLSAYADWDYSRQSYSSHSELTYLVGNEDGSQGSEYATGFNPSEPVVVQSGRVVSHYNNTKASVQFVNNSPDLYISNTVYGYMSRRIERSWLSAPDGLDETVKGTVYNFRNRLTLTKRFGKKAFTISSETTGGNNPFINLNAFSTTADTLIVKQRAGGFRVHNSESMRFSLPAVLNIRIGTSASFRYDYESFKSHGIAGLQLLPIPGNDLSGSRVTLELNPYFMWKTRNNKLNVDLSVPLSQTYYRYTEHIDKKVYDNTPFLAGYSANITGKLIKFNVLSLNISQRESLGSFSNFITRPFYSSYRNVGAPGNGIDSRIRNFNASLSSIYKRAVYGMNLLTNVSYNRASTGMLRSLTITPDETRYEILDRRGKFETWGFNSSFNKTLFGKSSYFGISVAGSASKNTMAMQGRLFITKNYSAAANGYYNKSFFNERLQTSTSATFSYVAQKTPGLHSSTFRNYSAKEKVSLVPAKDVVVSVDASWQAAQLMPGVYQKDIFMNAEARWTVNTTWELELWLANLTNRKHYNVTVLKEGVLSTTSTPLIPLQTLLTIRMRY